MTKALFKALRKRYEVRAYGWPQRGWSVVGSADTLEGAEKIITKATHEPGCLRVTLMDKQENREVFTRYAGILR